MRLPALAAALCAPLAAAAEPRVEICDRHAFLAGEIMALRHAGAGRDAADRLEIELDQSSDVVAAYADRAWDMPVPHERMARSSQIFHFAEDAYIMCMAVSASLVPIS